MDKYKGLIILDPLSQPYSTHSGSDFCYDTDGRLVEMMNFGSSLWINIMDRKYGL